MTDVALINTATLEMPEVGEIFPTTRRHRHVKSCGTAAAYRRHFRRGGRELPVDPACAAWHRKDERKRYRRRK